jgi:hypothetical protein
MSLIEDLFNNGQPRGCAGMNDEQAEKAYPLLMEMLNQREYKNGIVRTPPTIMIRRVPGAIEVVIQDHDFLVQKVATSRSMAGAWKALERALGDPECAWRPYKSRMDSELRRKEGKKKP